MSGPQPATLPVLVVGATGSLGGKVVDSLLARGQNVRVRWFDSGCHVADTRRRTQLFGPVPTAEEAVHRLTGTLRARTGRRSFTGERCLPRH